MLPALHPTSHRVIEIDQPEGRTDKRGQFVLPVSPPKKNADALFEQAQAAEEAGNVAEAERGPRTEASSLEGDRCPDEPAGFSRLRRIDRLCHHASLLSRKGFHPRLQPMCSRRSAPQGQQLP